jgi:hypothetical protein
VVLGRKYNTLRSRKEAGQGVSSGALKGSDGAGGASYRSVLVFIVVLCRRYRRVRRARAILQLRQHQVRGR